jgi:hypothetical protein
MRIRVMGGYTHTQGPTVAPPTDPYKGLQPHAGIFPISRDRERRLGSICTAWPMWATNS